VLAGLRRRTSARRRAPDLLAIARSLDETIAEAWERPHPAWCATTPLHDARARRAVRDATPQLRSLAQALCETDGVEPDTLRMCRSLVSDGFGSPLYGSSAEVLRSEAGRLRFLLLSDRTPA
jgi:hypothetical protein